MQERAVLRWAVEFAAARNCPVVAETSDRLLRSSRYRCDTAPHAVPSVFEFFRFAAHCRRVRLATILHPDTTWRRVRAHQTSRGMKITPCKAGDKKAWRMEIRPRVIERALSGDSDRLIAEEEGVPRSNVQRWLREEFGERAPN
jgi:hypothetical protein